MDNKPEDWEKWRRIKAEKEKASRETLTENKANLQYLDAKSFAVRKGLSRNPEAYRAGSEKISGICLVTIILGAILDAVMTFIMVNLKMGLVDSIPAKIEEFVYLVLVLIPAFASIVAAIEAVIYSYKTRKKLTGPLINTIITIIIFVAHQKIRELIIISS